MILTPRRFAAFVFVVSMAVLTTAGDLPSTVASHTNDKGSGSPADVAYLERMVLTIGLGATLSLLNAVTAGWLVRYTFRSSEQREERAEQREARLLKELADERLQHGLNMDRQRSAFENALERVDRPCPLETGPGHHVPRILLDRLAEGPEQGSHLASISGSKQQHQGGT
jgi:hypothetical protein